MCLNNNEADWISLHARAWQPQHVEYARQLFQAHAGGKEWEERQYPKGVSVTENIHEHSHKKKQKTYMTSKNTRVGTLIVATLL
jgi:hypothetical protein